MRECRLAAMAAAHSPAKCTPPGTSAPTFSGACALISRSSAASGASSPRGHGAKNSKEDIRGSSGGDQAHIVRGTPSPTPATPYPGVAALANLPNDGTGHLVGPFSGDAGESFR